MGPNHTPVFLNKHDIKLYRSSSQNHICSRKEYPSPILIFPMIDFQSIERYLFSMSFLETRMSLSQVQVKQSGNQRRKNSVV